MFLHLFIIPIVELVMDKKSKSGKNQDIIKRFCWVGSISSEEWFPDFKLFTSVNDLKISNIQPSLIVVSLPEQIQDSALHDIRQNPTFSHSIVLVCKKSPYSPYLANGFWDESYTTLLQHYEEKLALVKLDFEDDIASKLLCYLWLHSDSRLKPISLAMNSRLYVYPLLLAWGIASEDCFSWLNGVKRNNWIETDQLVNRIRLCPDCHCGHLNYIDSCPRCQNIDIISRSSLHCFNCGHVGDKDNFKKLTSLQCPNCLQNLRHIGVDYDRPIENQHCQSCEHIFVEASVEAECLHCSKHHAVDELHVRNVYTFKLSTQGRLLVRQGKKQTLFSLNAGEQMNSQQLMWLIDWQNKLAKRHKQTHSILCLQLVNFEEFILAEGESKALAQLDAFQDRLRSIVRVTDACTNYTDNGLLMLLPMTATSQLKVICEKLFDVKDYQDNLKIDFSIKAIMLPADIGENVENWLTDQILQAKPLKI